MNITPTDLEVMENEIVMNSGRVSIESTRSQQVSLNNARAALGTPGPRYPMTLIQPHFTKSHSQAEMKQKISKLEQALSERDRLIESLRKEGTTMFFTLQKIEQFLQVGVIGFCHVGC